MEFLLTALSLQSEVHSGSELIIPGEGLCLGLNEWDFKLGHMIQSYSVLLYT